MATKKREYWTRTSGEIAVEVGRMIAPWPSVERRTGNIVDEILAEAQTRQASGSDV